LVDARAAYEKGPWTAALWGKNLTNQTYVTGGFDISGIGVASAYLNVPRTFGVDLRYRFW
jgi:iron complex outermembrane receptor protein